MSEATQKSKTPSISNFIVEYGVQDRLARFIGISFVILIAIGIIYIGTWQAAYAKQFYKVRFKINFLEGVQPGMKIRYQGGVLIGEVINIESDYHDHYLNAIIKNDFKIIKYGTKISLKEQGSFGGSYIDVSTIPYYFDGEVYTSEEIIQISEIVPIQDTLSNFLKLFQADTGKESLIVSRLIDIKLMINNLATNKNVMPNQVNQMLKNTYKNVLTSFYQLKEFNQKLFIRVEKFNNNLTKLADNLRANLPVLRKQTDKIYSIVQYNPSKISEKQFMHDEQMYYSIMLKLRHINTMMQNFKNHPYKLIFESGL